MPALPAPFDGPPSLTDPSGKLKVWLTAPAGMVDQLSDGCTYTAAMAHWLVGPATDAMLALGARTGVERFRFVHDWRGVASYESDARIAVINWGRTLGRGRIERIAILIAPDSGTLFRMAVHAGTTAMAVLGIHCTIEEDIGAALVGLKPAA